MPIVETKYYKGVKFYSSLIYSDPNFDQILDADISEIYRKIRNGDIPGWEDGGVYYFTHLEKNGNMALYYFESGAECCSYEQVVKDNGAYDIFLERKVLYEASYKK